MKFKTFLVCILSLFVLTSCDSIYEDPNVVDANRESITDISGISTNPASSSDIVNNSIE